MLMARSLREVAEHLKVHLVGDPAVQVSGVASIKFAESGDLVFVDSEKNLNAAMGSKAAAVIAGKFAFHGSHQKSLLIADQPKLAFARAAGFLSAQGEARAGAASSSEVHATARLGQGVTVGEHAVIGASVIIGEGTSIGAGCVVGQGVSIGQRCHIYPNVTIYSGARLGSRVVVHAGAVLGSDGFGYVRDRTTGRYEQFPQIGRLEIEDDVEIGANATVDRGALEETRIRRGTKIDNLVHVGHNVDVGEDVVIAAQTGISGSSVIEKNVIVGGQVGIADHVTIEEGAILGAQSGVPSSKVVRGNGIVFWGTPARPIRQYLKELAILARLAKVRKG
jgi:UDP-3-O-[3-hydroxymyristoyl] glucosamine N-acyltransferase